MKTLLAYLHPLVQMLVLLVALATLRLGLVLKRHHSRQRLLQNRHEVFQRRTKSVKPIPNSRMLKTIASWSSVLA